MCSVLVRLRPCHVGQSTSLIPRSAKSLVLTGSQEEVEYHFDAVMSPATSQRLVFEKIEHLVGFAAEGGRASIISYGQVRCQTLTHACTYNKKAKAHAS